MIDILLSALYAVIFMAVSLGILAAGFWVLDVLTPGHKLGDKLAGTNPATASEVGRTGPSHSAALVTSAWVLAQAGIIFTAIWTNAHGTDFLAALGWTVAFSVIGLALQSVAFIILDALTPGNLGDEICTPGETVPLAKVAAANVLAVGLIVIASIA